MRPDPQAIWRPLQSKSLWAGADAVFERLTSSKGKWNVKGKMPEKWIVKYKDLSFWVRLTPFKHTGLFPEQAIQWDWIASHVAKALRDKKKNMNILNLFGYTGAATIAAAAAGARLARHQRRADPAQLGVAVRGAASRRDPQRRGRQPGGPRPVPRGAR